MTADELNDKLAEVLGYEIYVDSTIHGMRKPGTDDWLPDDFDPTHHIDDLRDYVLPEVERRGLKDAYMNAVWYHCKGEWYTLVWYMATASPAVLAEAALKVLEGGKA